MERARECNCANSFFIFDVCARVEFESAYNLLVAIALVESQKAVLDQILASLISEPTQKTALKFKVYVKSFLVLFLKR